PPGRSQAPYRPDSGRPPAGSRSWLCGPGLGQEIRAVYCGILATQPNLSVGPDHAFSGLIGILGAGWGYPGQSPPVAPAVVRAPQAGGNSWSPGGVAGTVVGL